MTDLKVALISDEFPPFTFGGVGAVCHDLAYSLSKKKIDTTVFCRGSRRLTFEAPNDYLEIIRLPCLDIPPRSVWFQLQNFHRFSKLLKNHTILHAVSPGSGTFCVDLKKKSFKPLVTSCHGLMWRLLHLHFNTPIRYWTAEEFAFGILGYPLYHFLDKKIIKNSDRLVVCSSSLLKDMNKIYGDSISQKICLIPNGIALEKIDSILSDKRDITKSGLSLVYYGRLLWPKGVTYLLRAIANLTPDFPDINLKIFGTGPLMNKLRKQISNLSLEDNVFLQGYIPSMKLIEEIRKADVVVLPSLMEAQPIAVLEAMACKKAPIVFDFPFSREYIVNMYNGLLARAKDENDLSDKIRLLLTDKKLRVRLEKNAYDYVKKHHNWDVLVKRYISIYEFLS
ncbi:MAG: glycosyltransferase family 4 protein [Candidatus Hodarchaeota archaeon]